MWVPSGNCCESSDGPISRRGRQSRAQYIRNLIRQTSIRLDGLVSVHVNGEKTFDTVSFAVHVPLKAHNDQDEPLLETTSLSESSTPSSCPFLDTSRTSLLSSKYTTHLQLITYRQFCTQNDVKFPGIVENPACACRRDRIKCEEGVRI